MKYLAVDPGETSGWATFDSEGNMTGWGQILGFDNFDDWLDKQEPFDVVIYENYRLFKQRALQQAGSKLLTVQIIGALKSKARKWGARVVEQNPDIKKIAQMWSQEKPDGAHHKNSHKIDAYNHGFYYLVNQGVCKTALQEGRE